MRDVPIINFKPRCYPPEVEFYDILHVPDEPGPSPYELLEERINVLEDKIRTNPS